MYVNGVTELDKYEYNLKLEEIDKLVDQGDYEEAASMADTIDWRRVRNVRTLCLISEIYEAAGRLDKSKDMLVRAYRKSPVGRTVLYRLVEVTTALGEYDEALEYYSEYVQVAPHDNNRYILKYMIYKGRGSSPEELIEILEEYLGQEYTERWAYELALNYQEAGQIQKCLATCDDLVLWFHSGKYVRKALDLKKQYSDLTPKQEEIYENCLQEEAQEDYLNESEEESSAQDSAEMDGEVIAENIIAETEKEIAGAVTARKAEQENVSAEEGVAEISGETEAEESTQAKAEENTAEEITEEETEARALTQTVEQAVSQEPSAQETLSETPEEEPAKSENEMASDQEASAEAEVTEGQEISSETETPAGQEIPAEAEASAQQEVPSEAEALAENETDAEAFTDEPVQDDLQVELAKSVRKVVSGVARKPELNEEDVPAAVEDRLRSIQDTPEQKEPEPKAGKISIDDILLAMGEKGKQVAAAAREQDKAEEDTVKNDGEETAVASAAGEFEEQTTAPQENVNNSAKGRTITDVITEDLTQEELEALKYSDNPEKFLKNRNSLPVYSSEEELSSTREIVNTKEELKEAARKEQLEAKTIRIPSDEVARAYGEEEETTERKSFKAGAAAAAAAGTVAIGAEAFSANKERKSKAEETKPEEEAEEMHAEATETADEMPAEKSGADGEIPAEESETAQEIPEEAVKVPEETPAEATETAGAEEQEEAPDKEAEESFDNDGIPVEEVSLAEEEAASDEEDSKGDGSEQDEGSEQEETPEEEEEYFDDMLTIAPQLRGLFPGFTEVDGLEDQIANAILQAMSRGDDRTSRTGNILIFGAHGSGKTTLAIGIARAIAQEKGDKVAKMARIYASDLNRKDIASTIAKIAGGTLIIEEAGDLEDKTVEQLTTAMEFRTDGLIVILEDEQRYVHELLMNHPRFTMKFTAQIYLPDYTLEELLVFGQQHANDEGCRISDEAIEVIAQKVSDAEQTETPITIADMINMVDDAIRHSNKLTRKMSMGKKRYDEDDFVLLFAKDFK